MEVTLGDFDGDTSFDDVAANTPLPVDAVLC